MKYKLVALDLDGTLLNNKNTISEYTSSILNKLDNLGIKIVIATGRSYSSLKPKIKKLKLEHPVVCYNGAMIRNGKNDEILYNSTIPVDITKELIELSRQNDLHFQGFIDGEFHYEKESEYSEFYKNLSGLPGKIVDFDTLPNPKMTKSMFISEPRRLKEIEGEIRSKYSDRAFIAYSKPTFLEIMNITASKSKALDKLVLEYGFTSDDVIAFGDGPNDEDMLSYAGKGVVMVNGYENLKSKFEVSEYTNDEDGVAKYLDKLINEN